MTDSLLRPSIWHMALHGDITAGPSGDTVEPGLMSNAWRRLNSLTLMMLGYIYLHNNNNNNKKHTGRAIARRARINEGMD